MSFYDHFEDVLDTLLDSYDQPLLDLMKNKKYRDLWSKNSSSLNPRELMRDFLIDFGLVKDWTEYIKMRLELAEVEQ